MVSAGARAAGRSWSRDLTVGPPTVARCAGTREGAAGLIDGITDVLAAECGDLTASGEDHAAKVVMCLFADCLDARDALEA